MLNQHCTLSTCIESYIKPLLTRVLATDKLGTCCGTIEVDSISSSCGQTKGDRFKLSIPYARHNLTWNVFFDSQCPEMGPDFIFNDSNFLSDVDVDTLSANIPSLAKWNSTNRNALVDVLLELITCYKQYQVQLLRKHDRLLYEYTTLIGSTLVKADDVEVILLPTGFKPTEARFLINLPLNVSQMPKLQSELKNNVAKILITFTGPDWSRVTREVCLSKSLEETLCEMGPLHLPYLLPDQFLIDYIVDIKKYVEEKANLIIESAEKRREYLATIIELDSGSVLEFDNVNYTYIAILFKLNKFHVILNIRVPLGFPREKPVVHLRSVYHMTAENVPCVKEIDIPYDINWTPAQIYKSLRECLKKYITQFKANATKTYS